MEKTVRHRDIVNIDPPKVLYYGDSHMGRLKWWSDGDYGRFKPNALEDIVLSESRFAYSGGLKWADVHSRVNGINLPAHQKQGDTWGPIVASEFEPDYIYIMWVQYIRPIQRSVLCQTKKKPCMAFAHRCPIWTVQIF